MGFKQLIQDRNMVTRKKRYKVAPQINLKAKKLHYLKDCSKSSQHLLLLCKPEKISSNNNFIFHIWELFEKAEATM